MNVVVYIENQTERPVSTLTRLRDRVDVFAHMPALARIGSGALNGLIVSLSAVLVLLGADIAFLGLHPGAYWIDIGSYSDSFFLENANNREVAPDGKPYRWSTDNTALRLSGLGGDQSAIMTLKLGGRPVPGELTLTLNGRALGRFDVQTHPRNYTVVLPRGTRGDLAIGIRSSTLPLAEDTRHLGVKLERVALAVQRGMLPLPTAAQFLAQVGVILAMQLVTLRLGWRWQAQALLAGLLALGLAALLASVLLMASAYLLRLLVAAGVLAALTWIGLPLVERWAAGAGAITRMVGAREIRVLWALMLLSCTLRLVGVLYPTFGGQDLNLNLRRLNYVFDGQTVIIAKSSEFADGLTIYPPGPYLAVLPGAALIDDQAALLQGGLALLDGTTALLVAMLTLRLGGNRDAARFAALLYAGSLPTFTAMAYGFSAQIFGQWFTTPLALVLLFAPAPPERRTWGIVCLLLLFGVLSHIGVAILGVAWVGLILALMLLRPNRALLWAIGLVGASGLFALVGLYIDIVEIMLNHAASSVVGQRPAGVLLPGATPLLLKGLRLSYGDIGLALLPLGLLLLARVRRAWDHTAVLLAWLLTALLFLLIDLALAVQVRYFYFALPLALAVIALVPGRLAARGRWARLVAWSLIVGVAFGGAALWFSTVIGQANLSLTPLTH
jgi:hypothetical protein